MVSNYSKDNERGAVGSLTRIEQGELEMVSLVAPEVTYELCSMQHVSLEGIAVYYNLLDKVGVRFQYSNSSHTALPARPTFGCATTSSLD